MINLVIAFVIGLVCTAICELVQPDQTSWDVGAGDLAGFFVTQSLAMLGGFALATLLLNTPASIVLFVVYRFVLPGVFAGLAALSDWFDEGRALARLPGRAGRHLRVGPLRAPRSGRT